MAIHRSSAMNLLILALRIALLGLFLILIIFQTLSIPGGIAHQTSMNPAQAAWRWPATIFAAFEILCVQVVVICTWQLLGLVRSDRIFSARSLRWVDAIIISLAAGWLVAFAVFCLLIPGADDPGGPMVMLLGLTAGGVFWLLVVVMRNLLKQAIGLRTDLDAVI